MLVKQSPVIPEFWAQETILFNGDKPHCLFFTDCAGFLRASVRALKQPHVVYQCDSGSGKICVAPQHLPMILWIPENDVPQHEYIALHGNVVEYLSDVPPIALFEEFSIEDSGPIWIVTAELIISSSMWKAHLERTWQYKMILAQGRHDFCSPPNFLLALRKSCES